MLATGGSATAAIEVLKRWGAVEPVRIKLVNLIAAPEGVAAVTRPTRTSQIHCAALDRAAQREGLHHARASATPATASSGRASPADFAGALTAIRVLGRPLAPRTCPLNFGG